MTYRRIQYMLSKLGHPLYTRDGVLAEVRRLITEMVDAYDPLVVRCRDESCNAVWRASDDVKPDDVLMCPSCGLALRVLDTGPVARVEYIRTREEPAQPTCDPEAIDKLVEGINQHSRGTRPLKRKALS